MSKLTPGFFILSILGLLFMGLTLMTGHSGLALVLSKYIFTLFLLGVALYVL